VTVGGGVVQRRWEEQAERTAEDWRCLTSGKASRDVMDFSGMRQRQTRRAEVFAVDALAVRRWCHAVVSCRVVSGRGERCQERSWKRRDNEKEGGEVSAENGG
jgi:hypothetical protein